MKHWKQIILIVVTLVVYCVLMSIRPGITNPTLKTAAGVVAAISIGIAMVLGLRLGRRISGQTRR